MTADEAHGAADMETTPAAAATSKKPAPVFPNPDAAKKAEEVASKVHTEVNTKAMPARQVSIPT